MYKRILIPVDGSPTGQKALQHGLALAKEQSATVVLAYVVEQLQVWATEGQIDLGEVMREGGKTILAEALDSARKAGVDAQTVLVEAGVQRTARSLVEQAGKSKADLIVMGTHGRRGIDHLIMGSVAEGVVRTTPVPVLLVRGE